MSSRYYTQRGSSYPLVRPLLVVLDGRLVSNPTDAQLSAAGYAPYTPPPLPPAGQQDAAIKAAVAEILAAWARIGIREVPAGWDEAIAAARSLADAPGADRVAILETVAELMARRIALADAGGNWADVLAAAERE